MKKNLIIIMTIIIVATGIYFYFQNKSVVLPVSEKLLENEELITDEETANAPMQIMVIYREDGFNPKFATIKKGGKIIFRNDSLKPMWVASARHPEHDEYEGTSITKCGTAEATGMFDMCKEYESGTSWEFQFDNVGEWRFHDHFSASHFGSVKVVE